MLARFLVFIGSMAIMQAGSAYSYPVPLGTRQPLEIPAKFVEQYTFFEDSEAAGLLYVVPRIGTVDLRSSGQTVWPRFTFDTGLATNGYFFGYDFVRLGGTFRPDARPMLYKELSQLVQGWDMTLNYAPFFSHQVELLSLGTLRRPGDHLDCRFEERLLQDGRRKISVPRCMIRESEREIDIDLFQSFALLVSEGGSVGNLLGWSARTLPGWEPPLRQKLEQGAGWDDVFVLTVAWDLTASGQERVSIDTNSIAILQALKTLIDERGLRSWDASDIEALGQRIVDCGEACGLRTAANRSPAFKTAFAQWLAGKFFVRMNQESQVLWVPKSFPLNDMGFADEFESEYLRIPGLNASQAETRFLIHCLLSPENGSKRVRWDTEAPDCMEAVRP